MELFKAAVFTEKRLGCSVQPRTLPAFEAMETELKNDVESVSSQLI